MRAMHPRTAVQRYDGRPIISLTAVTASLLVLAASQLMSLTLGTPTSRQIAISLTVPRVQVPDLSLPAAVPAVYMLVPLRESLPAVAGTILPRVPLPAIVSARPAIPATSQARAAAVLSAVPAPQPPDTLQPSLPVTPVDVIPVTTLPVVTLPSLKGHGHHGRLKDSPVLLPIALL